MPSNGESLEEDVCTVLTGYLRFAACAGACNNKHCMEHMPYSHDVVCSHWLHCQTLVASGEPHIPQGTANR